MWFHLILVFGFLNLYSSYYYHHHPEIIPEIIIQWKQIRFADLPYNDTELIGNRPYFVPYNNVPQSVVHHKNRLFIGFPRRQPSIPATLTTINLNDYLHERPIENPSLFGYPSYQMNELHNNYKSDPNRIVSVYRPRVDICDRLWFVDTGILEYPGNLTFVQRPSIWVIDLNTDKMIRRFEIPETIVGSSNGMISIAIDVNADFCDDAYAYIPDLLNFQLITYSFKQNRAWRFLHNYFHIDPLRGDFNVANIKFQWDDGIFSIALGNSDGNNFRSAYFHPYSSNKEFAVSTEILKNETLSKRSYHEEDFKLLGSRGNRMQSASHAFHGNSNVLFYTLTHINAIGCINMNRPFDNMNFDIVYQNNETLVYPSDLSIDTAGQIWFISNQMPKFIYSKLNINDINFRIWRISVADAIAYNLCDAANTNY